MHKQYDLEVCREPHLFNSVVSFIPEFPSLQLKIPKFEQY